MSEIQLIHYMEQVDAARKEFKILLEFLNEDRFDSNLKDPNIQRLCWFVFLFSKGLMG